MKRFYFILLVCLPLISVHAQSFKAGGGIHVCTGYKFNNEEVLKTPDGKAINKSGNFGLTAGGIYKINENLSIAAFYFLSFPHKTKYTDEDNYKIKTSVNTSMFDADAHYIFMPAEKIDIYGIAGLNILFSSLKNKNEVSDKGEEIYRERDNALGVNLGIGADIYLTDKYSLFCDAKYIIGKYDQLKIDAGILINLKYKANKSSH